MRLFYAVPLPQDAARAAAQCARAAQAEIPGRYTLPENYHITLAFIGDVQHERLQDAHDVLLRCAAAFPRPRIALERADFFGRAENGILILRAAAFPSLEPLHDALIRGLAMAGLPHDPGPFAPHITLARHARITQQALDRAALPLAGAQPFTADCAHLYLSARDEKDILRYTPLRSAAFL
ncbi:MAG: RNA 2',3'-cyclic phosphodiesterase [Clostridia bacterium]|nr:RNA 2',3'-cyclic phosphodiesterase [Clostridia bacterium]